jgi:hypothetical protein
LFYVVEKSDQFGWVRRRNFICRTREFLGSDVSTKIWWGIARCAKQTVRPVPFFHTLRPAAVTDKMLAWLNKYTLISTVHLVDAEDTGRALGAFVLLKLKQVREHLIV